MEDRIQLSALSLFTDEHLFSLEKSGLGVSSAQKIKPLICKLNFADETTTFIQRNSVPVEVNKMTEFTKFTPPTTHKRYKDTPNLKLSNYKSSPMQMFNSFSANSSFFLTQSSRIDAIHKGLRLPEEKASHKKICCNCKKSHCLKLYCQCFINKTYCQGCHCTNCFNTKDHENIRNEAMQSTLQRNPLAFDPKISPVEETVNI